MASIDHNTVASSYVALAVDTAQAHYKMTRTELLDCAGLDDADIADSNQVLASAALWDVFRHVLDKTGDMAFGLRMAERMDLRMQGFWGYALLSSMTLRQRVGIHLSYQRSRSPARTIFIEQAGRAILDMALPPVPEPLLTLFLDWAYATVCITHRQRLGGKDPGFEMWMGVREQPHHHALRALAGGAIVFDAPYHRIQFPAWHLDLALAGDPHLGLLAQQQLDSQLAALGPDHQHNLVEAVRQRLNARLAHDPSIERVAADLRLSTRSLRRHLGALGTTFQDLLEELRRERAVHYLSRTQEPVDAVAAQLGYADSANFRRAFRRWMGVSPGRFRNMQDR